MLCQYLPLSGKFKFCFLEIAEFFKYHDLWLVESLDVEPMDMEVAISDGRTRRFSTSSVKA